MQVACETFCLDDDDTFLEATMALRSPMLSSATVRFVEAKEESLAKGRPPTLLMVLEGNVVHKYVHCLLLMILYAT
jgi:hypothetical protein